MSFSPGEVLTHYEILSPLGGGAMGEVWRARDTRLGREVALKVLPEAFVDDEERLRRFEREARTLASLNHPNIATIHGLETEGSQRLIALELVEGEDLADLIERGALDMASALDVCRQIAEGLEAAHGAGVVHRDLKPHNVRVTPEGRVKILDFGLAKPLSGDVADDSLTTEDGRMFGTPAYMSPEQARGRPVCPLADVWAFGCILFETLSGRRPFGGSCLADVLAAVTGAAPDWDVLPRAVPASVRGVVERCLIKDPRQRLQHVGEARIVLEDPGSHGVLVAAEPRENGSRPWLLPLLAVVLAGVAWWAGGLRHGAGAAPRTVSFTVSTPPGHELHLPNPRSGGLDGVAPPLAVSPDGSSFVYLAREAGGVNRLYLRRLDAATATVLPGTEDAIAPFFSPDGEWVGFFRSGAIEKVALGGGVPQAVTTASLVDRPSATWGPDDTIVFTRGVNAAGRLLRVPAAGGDQVTLTSPDFERGESWYGMPQFLPGGGTVLFTVATASGRRAAVLDLGTGDKRLVEGTGEAAGARYVPFLEGAQGMLVYAQDGKLLAVGFDPAAGALSGIPRPVVASLRTSALGLGQWDCAADGTLVYVQGSVTETSLVLRRRSGEVAWRSPESGAYQHPRLSPDGGRLLFDAEGAERHIWAYDLEHGTPTRLTAGYRNMDPLWAPGADRIVFSRFLENVRSLHVQDVGRVGAVPRRLVADVEAVPGGERASHQIGGTWTPAGELLFTMSGDQEEDIWLVSGLDGGTVRPLLHGPGIQGFPSLSPDGRHLAYVSDELGTLEVFVCTYPDLASKQRISRSGGSEPLWSPDGTELFFRTGADFLSVPMVEEAAGLRAGEPTLIFSGFYDSSPTGHQHYDVSRDGQLFALVEIMLDESPNEMRVILDWRPWAEEVVNDR